MDKETLKPAITAIAKIIDKYDLSYDQLGYVVKQARKSRNLKHTDAKYRKIERLSKAEQKLLIQTAYNLRGHRGLMIKTLLCTGARVSEFVEIKVEDFLFDEQTIVIRKAKGDKQRVVPIPDFLAQELKTHIGTRTNGYLFHARKKSKYTTRRIQQIVKEAALEAGITKRVHPHLLRHTVATFLLEQGMPLEQIQVFLGHERIANTQIYAKNSTQQIKDSYNIAMRHF